MNREDNLDDSKVGLSKESEPKPNTEMESHNIEVHTNNVSNKGELFVSDKGVDSFSTTYASEETDEQSYEPMDTSFVETSEANTKLAEPSQDKNITDKGDIESDVDNANYDELSDIDKGMQCDSDESKNDLMAIQSVTKESKEFEKTDSENLAGTDTKEPTKTVEETMEMLPTSTEEVSPDQSGDNLNEGSLVGSDEDSKNISSEKDQNQKSASAFQRLASLGVIAAEEPIEESKESLLKKLASRGSISITPSGGGAISQNSSLTTTSVLPKYKPGPKSAMTKQKSKKIKIDPGKSMDIDKDFDSLINFLSAKKDDEKDEKPPNLIESTQTSILTENLNLPQDQPDTTSAGSDSCLEKTVDGANGIVEETITNETGQEIDNESHDESKLSHSSDHLEDNEERLSITSQPRNVIEEGSAEILLSSKNVFYNKVQEFNRDMSIAALTVFSEMHQQDPRTRNRGKKRKATDNNESDSSSTSTEDVFEPGKKAENGITILEALSATGLRSVRYAREIPGVKEIFANDLSEDAVESIKKNIEHNGVEELVTTTRSDASFLMYKRQSEQQWYDAIDLDPYGCPARFLDSAVQVVRDGGLLLVTCTDMAILAGNSPESCHAKYGAVSLRSTACHEMAIRIALQCIESHANLYGRYTVPLLSFSADFYIRVIVQVYTSPVTCKKTTSKLSMVYQCTGCQTFTFHPLGVVSQENVNSQPKFSLVHSPPVNVYCFHCQHKHHMGGPIWTAPIHSSKFVESMLRVVESGRFGTSKRMQGMLEVIREELPDVPLYYTISGLCSRLHCQAIPLIDIRSAILNAGYRVSSSHAAPTAIKTNAPSKIIWDIMRCWVHMNPISQKRLVAGSVPANIVLEPPNLIANFDIHPKARPSSSMRKLLRYQPNPEKNWGPGMRARCNNSEEDKDEKRRLNQNKNKAKSATKKTVEIIEVVTIDDEDEVLEDTSMPTTETVGTLE